jgi:hypothetical protein
MDHLIDMFSTWRRSVKEGNEKLDNSKTITKLSDFEKTVFIVGTLIVPILVLLPTTTPRLGLIYACATRSQMILLSGFVLVSCCRCYPRYFPHWAVTVIVLLLWITCVIQGYAINDDREVTVLRNVLFYLQIVAGAGFVICIGCWLLSEFVMRFAVPRLLRLLRASWRGGDRPGGKTDVASHMHSKHAELAIVFPAVYTLAAIAAVLMIAALGSLSGSFYDFTEQNVMMLNIPIFIFVIMMALIKSQFAEYELTDYLYRLLENKRSYVRYITR